MADSSTIVSWLLTEARRTTDLRALINALTEWLEREGVALSRLSMGVATLHPEMTALRYEWNAESRFVQEAPVPHGIEKTEQFTDNPYRALVEGAPRVRRRLTERTGTFEYAIFHELAAAGHTDYLALPVAFGNGTVGHVTFCTDRAEGLFDGEIRLLEEINPVLAAVVENHATHRMMRYLMDTYLGHEASRRVLTGRIRRGEGDTIRAVIWLCDLRGFTRLSDRLPLNFLTAVLNDYFEAMAGPVNAQGGEVLKLIGDAMLAIFRISDEEEIPAICETALSAAELAIANMKLLNRRRQRDGKPSLEYGLALHVGDVLYGNVGSANRLDFTVIGPAVNLTARLETLAGTLGRTLVTSSEFARFCPVPLQSIGLHGLKGVDEPQQVFVPFASDAH